mmetsp:Transcript_14740/g.35101  ORF Transcript_14740/g.35101 Transcript_14740/m.35101 type:complete len:87 (-) Transcript_14740:1187-1447(-)
MTQQFAERLEGDAYSLWTILNGADDLGSALFVLGKQKRGTMDEVSQKLEHLAAGFSCCPAMGRRGGSDPGELQMRARRPRLKPSGR